MNYEKFLLINNRQLKYKGVFRVDELFSAVNKAIEERGYTKREKKSEETVTNEGRSTYVELRPFKDITNYISLMIKIKIQLNGITETTTKIKEEKRVFQQGDVLVTFDAWLMSNYRDRWGMKPLFYFLKGMANKYLVKGSIETDAPGQLAQDTAVIYARIKKQLNSYLDAEAKGIKEEDIVKQVEAELKEEMEKEEKILKR